MNKPFDAVAWMRKRREEIEEQERGLTWEERSQRTLECIKDDPLWQRLKDRVVHPTGTLSIPPATSDR